MDADTASGFAELFSTDGATDGSWQAPAMPRTGESRLYGGVLIAQAVLAASHAAPRCHSLHLYFVSVGAMEQPFDVRTERVRDGGSFSTRRIEIRQGERLLLTGHSSHHDGDAGTDLAPVMPDLPAPESLPDPAAQRDSAEASGKPWRSYLTAKVLDTRPVELPGAEPGIIARRAAWFRLRRPLGGGDPATRRAAIGFASDAGLVHVGRLAHVGAGGGPAQMASLDHAIWFHREADPDEWMAHIQEATTLAHGRGLSRGQIFSRDGTLVASVAQEILARNVRPRP